MQIEFLMSVGPGGPTESPTNDTKTSVERNGRMISFDARRCYDGSTACMLSMLSMLLDSVDAFGPGDHTRYTTQGRPHARTRERRHYAKGTTPRGL